MIIRSHRNWPVASYDHHFHKSPPFKITPIEQKFGVWGLYSMPHICQNHPRASVKKVIIGYLIWITNNPPDLIWAKSFSWQFILNNWQNFSFVWKNPLKISFAMKTLVPCPPVKVTPKLIQDLDSPWKRALVTTFRSALSKTCCISHQRLEISATWGNTFHPLCCNIENKFAYLSHVSL